MTELEIYQAAAIEALRRVTDQRDEAFALLAEAKRSLEYTAVERDWESSRRILRDIDDLFARRDANV